MAKAADARASNLSWPSCLPSRDVSQERNLSNSNFATSLGVPVAASWVLPFYLHWEQTCFVASRLSCLAQPSPAVPHCSASLGQLCTRLQLLTSSSQLPQPRAGQPVWVPRWRGAEMEVGDSTGLFQTPLWFTGSCSLTSPATAHSRKLSRLAPLLSFRVSAQGDVDTGNPHHS